MAAQLGYCGIDRRRRPLAGDEIRGCWEARPAGAGLHLDAPLTIGPAASTDDRARRLEFVEVRATGEAGAGPDAATTIISASDVGTAAEGRWNLWGDLDR